MRNLEALSAEERVAGCAASFMKGRREESQKMAKYWKGFHDASNTFDPG